MKRTLSLLITIFLGAALAAAQAGGPSGGKPTVKTEDKPVHATKKGHKGGKKGTTTTAKPANGQITPDSHKGGKKDTMATTQSHKGGKKGAMEPEVKTQAKPGGPGVPPPTRPTDPK